MDWTWILTGLSLVGVVLNIHHHRSGFAVWMVTNATWSVVDFQAGLASQGWLFAIYFVLAVWGWFKWRQDEPPQKRIDLSLEEVRTILYARQLREFKEVPSNQQQKE